MTCQGLDIMGSNLNLVDLVVYPTTCHYHFYSIILLVIFLVVTLALYNRESEVIAKPDLISSMGVSASAVMVLSLIGTLVKSTQDAIPMIQQDIFLGVFAFWMLISAIWFFKS